MPTQRSWQPLTSRLRASEAEASASGAIGMRAPIEAELKVGDLRLEVDGMRVSIGDKQINLTAQEFDLFLLLTMEAGRPVSLSRLAIAIWQDDSPEHKRHLSVLMARLRSKIAGSVTHRLETARKRGYGLMPVSNNKIEEIKRVKDGLDVLQDIYRYARSPEDMDPDDLERMKWYGLFHRKQTPGFFMLRLRIPNGMLTSEQIRQIGVLSNRYGRGMIDMTTRQNFQLRWLQMRDIPAVFEGLDAVGIDYRQSGMDNIRNVTGCPMAGLGPDELFDASHVALEIQDATIGDKAFSNLPRKFNISVSGCLHDCATSQIHDLSLTPAIKDGRPGFNVKVGGAIGGKSPRYASNLNAFVTQEQAAEFCIAVVSLYRDEGPRDSRQATRLKVLLDDWGVPRFRAALEERYGPLESGGEDQLMAYSGDHLGVSRQKQDELNAVGCLVPVGRIKGDDLIEFGRLAEVYGSGELRLTNNQNVLIVNVATERLPALLAEPLLQKYSPRPPSWLRRTVSCTGIDFCHFSLIDTKATAIEFAETMERMMPLQAPLRVHWSGCQHGCGQHQIGDIGLLACRIRVKDEFVDAADVFVGGQPGLDPRLATKVLEGVPLTELPERVAHYLREQEAARTRVAILHSN
jgi:ferredoxin-nitrite reductase